MIECKFNVMFNESLLQLVFAPGTKFDQGTVVHSLSWTLVHRNIISRSQQVCRASKYPISFAVNITACIYDKAMIMKHP